MPNEEPYVTVTALLDLGDVDGAAVCVPTGPRPQTSQPSVAIRIGGRLTLMSCDCPPTEWASALVRLGERALAEARRAEQETTDE